MGSIIIQQLLSFVNLFFKNTFIITLGALAIGIVIRIVVAAVRTSFDKNRESMKVRGGVGYYSLAFFNAICKFISFSFV